MDKYVFWDEHLKLFSLLAEIAFQWSRVFHETKYIMGVHQFPNNCVFVMKVESTRNHDIFHWTVPIYAYILLVTTTYTLRLFIRRSESNRFPIISKRFTSYDYKNIYAQLTFITRTHIPRQGKLTTFASFLKFYYKKPEQHPQEVTNWFCLKSYVSPVWFVECHSVHRKYLYKCNVHLSTCVSPVLCLCCKL